MKHFVFTLLLLIAIPAAAQWDEVDGILGREGKTTGDVRKYGFPRTDLHVRVGEVPIEATLALGSWAAFRSAGGHAMAMGDLVLRASEVNRVVRAFESNGFEIAAIHNHLQGESPQVMYVHFSGTGELASLAHAVHAALEETSTPRKAAPAVKATSAQQRVYDRVQEALGRTGSMAGRVLQVSVPRAETIHDGDMEVPPAMGMATALNFQAVGDRVATTGDFVLIADEVNPVIRELQAQGIAVTALHSHMLRETPRLFFMHFWGVDTPEKIGAGLKAAISHVNVK